MAANQKTIQASTFGGLEPVDARILALEAALEVKNAAYAKELAAKDEAQAAKDEALAAKNDAILDQIRSGNEALKRQVVALEKVMAENATKLERQTATVSKKNTKTIRLNQLAQKIHTSILEPKGFDFTPEELAFWRRNIEQVEDSFQELLLETALFRSRSNLKEKYNVVVTKNTKV